MRPYKKEEDAQVRHLPGPGAQLCELLPCMHTFCTACYLGWVERSTCCPVERICENHILNSLVEAYLLRHPDRSHPEEDERSTDISNTITQDMLQPKVRGSFLDEEGSLEDLLELPDVNSESSGVSQPFIMCRQCPITEGGWGSPFPAQGPAASTEHRGLPGDTSSTSASVTTAQDYVCALQGSHAISTCSFQPVPDWRAQSEQDTCIAFQQCALCLQPFCHLCWAAPEPAVRPSSVLNLGDRCLNRVLSNNYESDILKNYLAARGLTC